MSVASARIGVIHNTVRGAADAAFADARAAVVSGDVTDVALASLVGDANAASAPSQTA